jgi:hypothetical protein
MPMLELTSGLILTAITLFSFVYSLPRNGKHARFVGTEWEGYTVVLMVGGFGLGAVFIILGLGDLLT